VFIIRNVAPGVVILDDLGIELQPLEEYNFSENESPNDVQISSDLRDRISAGDIVVLDPLDNVTALNTIRSLEAVDLANSPNYRIFGGDLNQLEDVVITTPTTNQLLRYNGSEWVNVTIDEIGTIVVEDEGVTVPGGPHGTLNFVGPGVVVTDAGNGEATVTITGTEQSHLLRTNGVTTQTFNTTPITVLFGTSVRTDTEFAYSAGVVTVSEAGWYDIAFDVTTQATAGTAFFSTAQATAQASIFINGVEDTDTRAYGWHHASAGNTTTFSSRMKVNLAANDDIEVRVVRSGGDNLGLQTLAQGCRLAIQSIDAP
jgi:hypothetical protein